MGTELRLLAILAHPDDESMGNGGVLAKYASEGIGTYLITGTRGEVGWLGDPNAYPGPAALGKLREAELRAAGAVLGLQEVNFLDYRDGELSAADPETVIAELVGHIRRIRPHVVVTFDQNGLYGHPDHMAVSRYATEAVIRAGRAVEGIPGEPHNVDKLYYMAWTQEALDDYETAFGSVSMNFDGQVRDAIPWPEWSISACIDASAHWQKAWDAIACHRSQLPAYETLLALPEEYHQRIWANQTYYRVFGVSSSNGVEDDLFAGLR